MNRYSESITIFMDVQKCLDIYWKVENYKVNSEKIKLEDTPSGGDEL